LLCGHLIIMPSLAWKTLVSASSPFVLRLEPSRTTNGQHLRNAFERLLNEQLNNNQTLFKVHETTKEAIMDFARGFPSSQMLPGTPLWISCNPTNGQITMTYQDRQLIAIQDTWLVQTLAYVYLCDKGCELIPGLTRQFNDHLQ
jgi:hypothetical protein